MFLRKRHQRYVLLHSYRDGRGRVRQRRLGHFEGKDALARHLQPERWQQWKAAFVEEHPEVNVDWQRLQIQAQKFVDDSDPADKPGALTKRRTSRKSREEKIEQHLRALTSLLEQESQPEFLQRIVPKLEQLLSEVVPLNDELGSLRKRLHQERAKLPPKRSFHPTDPQVVPYLEALHPLLQALEGDGQWDECARLLAQRVHRCPCPQAFADFGAILQLLGRVDEAIEQYECIPNREAVRHYNLASCCFQAGRTEQALEHLLRALNRDRTVADTLKRMEKGHAVDPYWQRYGRLWSQKARSFLQQVYRQFPVRRRLRQVGERGVQARSLLSVRARGYVLSKLDEPPPGLNFEP